MFYALAVGIFHNENVAEGHHGSSVAFVNLLLKTQPAYYCSPCYYQYYFVYKAKSWYTRWL